MQDAGYKNTMQAQDAKHAVRSTKYE